MTKSYIWPLFNRIIHVLLIVSFSTTYLISEQTEYLDFHVLFALIFTFLFILRIIWGIIGPKYSKFSDFTFDKNELKNYLTNPLSKTKEYIGHNPASSYAIITIAILTIFTSLSGMLLYGVEKNHGVFAYLHSIYYKDMLVLESVHEISANLLLVFIFVHMAGALLDKFVKKGDAIDSMVSGYKNSSSNIQINLSSVQKLFVTFSFCFTIVFVTYLFSSSKSNAFMISKNEKQNYAMINEDFEAECGSCHITYPPYLLPKKSWEIMMGDLENHFGDDASIDEETNHIISKFLDQNSAEDSTNEAAFKILHSLKDKKTIAITKTPYWEKRHKDIDEKVFLDDKIKSKANCNACHKDIENGLIENNLIQIPRLSTKQ
jgi:cytochrome b